MSRLPIIVLRDIPKQEARIDLWIMPIKGGFRGFVGLPTVDSWHYVSVLHNGQHVGCWCYTRAKDVVVKRFEDGAFVDEEEETAVHFTQLASSGAMNQVLLPYPLQGSGQWLTLTKHFSSEAFPPTIHQEDQGEDVSRFVRAFWGTHQGIEASFLAEFEYAFLHWLLEGDETMARWRHLLLSCYNAGERNIIKAEPLFVELARLLPAQFALLPDHFFQPNSWVMMQLPYMLEDMADSDLESLVEGANALKSYIASRTDK